MQYVHSTMQFRLKSMLSTPSPSLDIVWTNSFINAHQMANSSDDFVRDFVREFASEKERGSVRGAVAIHWANKLLT